MDIRLLYSDISRNNVKTLPKTFGGLEQLETLYVYNSLSFKQLYI